MPTNLKARRICLRMLVIVLALTASRANFPLFKRGWAAPSRQSMGVIAGTPGNPKKAENVLPSRRRLESDGMDRLLGRDSTSGEQPLSDGAPSDAPGCTPSFLDPAYAQNRGASVARSLHPKGILLSSHISAIPPPF